MNISLNAGGIVGALLSGAVMFAFLWRELASDEGSGASRAVIMAVIGGAFAGNKIWGKIFERRGGE